MSISREIWRKALLLSEMKICPPVVIGGGICFREGMNMGLAEKFTAMFIGALLYEITKIVFSHYRKGLTFAAIAGSVSFLIVCEILLLLFAWPLGVYFGVLFAIMTAAVMWRRRR